MTKAEKAELAAQEAAAKAAQEAAASEQEPKDEQEAADTEAAPEIEYLTGYVARYCFMAEETRYYTGDPVPVNPAYLEDWLANGLIKEA